jgi:hypothetical protein
MPTSRPFPAVTGGCFCGAVRYRLLTAPLFCYACHCADCHKHSGSVYACYTSIEADFLASISSTAPNTSTRKRPSGVIRRQATCPECATWVWSESFLEGQEPVTIDVRTGTLDHPELMEPDLHSHIESRIPWVLLPEGARTCVGAFDFRKEWPKSSVKRYDAAMKRMEDRVKAKEAGAKAGGAEAAKEKETDKETVEEEKETDKTPTAQSPEETEDDEEFEKRYRETEKALQERLEKLTLKLTEEEKGKA